MEKYSNLGKAEYRTGDLVVERQRSYQLRQPHPPNRNRSVEKCQRKIKYLRNLLDRYKEKKEWNSKQSGGQLRKTPHYDAIDSVIGCRDSVTLQNRVSLAQPGPQSHLALAKKRTMQSYQKTKRMVISQSENCRIKGGRERNAEETLRPKSRKIHLQMHSALFLNRSRS